MKKYILPVISTFLVTGGTLLYADVNMQEGLWRMTVHTEMSGMPMPMAIPDTSFTQCITKKDLIPKKQEEETGNCKIIEQKITGDTVSWVMECQGETKMRAVGSATYHGKTFDGVTNVTTIIPQMGTVKMKQKIRGKRIGECKK